MREHTEELRPATRDALGIRRSIRRRVMWVTVATTLIALTLSGAALLFYDAHAYRIDSIEELSAQADILALSSGPALAFDDRVTAEETLRTLRAREGIVYAALYDQSGRLFAAYLSDSGSQPAAVLPPQPAEGYRIERDQLVLIRRVVHDGLYLGAIELRARFAPFLRLADYLRILAAVMLASMAVAVLLSARLQSAVTRPIVAIADLARRVMDKRDYSLRAERTTDDELGVLVNAINGMLGEIEHEMTVRKDAEAALRAADARKDEFLATLAHELRNPLAALSSASHLLTRAADNREVSAMAREIVSRQVGHMARLLEDLLDVSRITRGVLALRREHCELRSVVDAAVETARPVIDAKTHRLRMELPEDTVEIMGDPVRLAQVVSNLLTNAAKYTDPGGDIAVTARREADGLVLSVTDNGVGIPAEALPQIFGMFSQVHETLERSQGGLGIGLALARGLVELHGGTIEARSAGPGRGSEFIVRLPLPRPASRTQAPRPGEAAAVRASRRILLVDDNRDALDSLAMSLSLDGHEVLTSLDGEAAVEMAATARPDVALLDIGMPNLNGYEVARRIRETPAGRSLMLVAVTGFGQEEDKQRAREAGFDHHLTKPVDPAVLQSLLSELSA